MYRLASEVFPEYPDPMPAFLLRDEGALLSALGEPRQTFGGEFLHASVCGKAAALMRSIVLNHPFVDGNKRMGLAATAAFLMLNGRVLTATQSDQLQFTLRVASDEPAIATATVERWLQRHSLSFSRFSAWLKDIDKTSLMGAWQLVVTADAVLPLASLYRLLYAREPLSDALLRGE